MQTNTSVFECAHSSELQSCCVRLTLEMNLSPAQTVKKFLIRAQSGLIFYLPVLQNFQNYFRLRLFRTEYVSQRINFQKQ